MSRKENTMVNRRRNLFTTPHPPFNIESFYHVNFPTVTTVLASFHPQSACSQNNGIRRMSLAIDAVYTPFTTVKTTHLAAPLLLVPTT